MKLVTGLLAAVLLLAGVGSSHAVVRIADDRGGRIGTYVDRYQGLRTSGETVIIDGLCASACTIVLAPFLTTGSASLRTRRSASMRPGISAPTAAP